VLCKNRGKKYCLAGGGNDDGDDDDDDDDDGEESRGLIKMCAGAL
jgi:hypothetical protein